jgi:hypothetical protein
MVACLEIERHEFALLIASTRTGSHHLAFLGLFLRSIGDNDPASCLLLSLYAAHDGSSLQNSSIMKLWRLADRGKNELGTTTLLFKRPPQIFGIRGVQVRPQAVDLSGYVATR